MKRGRRLGTEAFQVAGRNGRSQKPRRRRCRCATPHRRHTAGATAQHSSCKRRILLARILAMPPPRASCPRCPEISRPDDRALDDHYRRKIARRHRRMGGDALTGSLVAKPACRRPMRSREGVLLPAHAPHRPVSDAPTAVPHASLARCGNLLRAAVRQDEAFSRRCRS